MLITARFLTSCYQVELAPALADLLAVKEKDEKECTKRAAITASLVMQKHLVQQIEDIVDSEKKVSHEKLAEGVCRQLLPAVPSAPFVIIAPVAPLFRPARRGARPR